MKLYNLFIERLILPIGDFVLGTRYISTLKELRKIQNYSESQLNTLEKDKLRKLIGHAVNNIPYYSNLGLTPEADIKDFPILTKEILKGNTEQLLWHPEKKNELICEKSSGSSGVQSQVFMSKKEQSRVQAAQTLLWEWAGYSIGKTLLQTGITPNRGFIKSIKDAIFRTKYVSAFGLGKEEVTGILESLKNKPRSFFGGYASSLYVFAKHALERKIDSIRFDSVISWGDKMFEHYRSLIEKQFHTKVYDTYGTTEGFMIAGQKDLEYHYILSSQVYLEIVDKEGNEVPDGEMGYVLVTNLDAFEMPLIRYYLGDMAIKLPKERYPDKRDYQFPLLEKIIGRDTDIVITPTGKNMIVHFFTGIFEHLPEIRQFRIVQDELSSMVVEYIPDRNFNQDILNVVQSKVHAYLREEFPVHFRRVEAIPDSPSGKPQIIVSKVSK